MSGCGESLPTDFIKPPPTPMILAGVFSQNSKSQQKADFREKMTYFFDFYGPKIGRGGSSHPASVQKYQKP